MTVGFTSYNSSGSIQFDSNNPNYVLIKSGTTFTPFTGSFTIFGTVTVTNAINPIIALKGKNIGYFRLSQSGSTWTFYLYYQKNVNIGYNFQGYYIFDKVNTTSITTGMVIYDGSSNLLYSSERYPLRLSNFGVTANLTTVSPPSYVAPVYITGLDSSRSYAIILCSSRRANISAMITGTQWILRNFGDLIDTTVAGEVSVFFNYYNQATGFTPDPAFNPQAPYGSRAGGAFLAVDVTNYPTTYN